MSKVEKLISLWVKEAFPHLDWLPQVLSICSGVLLLVIIYYVARCLVLPGFEKLTVYISPHRLGQLKPLFSKLNRRLAGFICSVVFVSGFRYFYLPGDEGEVFYRSIGQIIAIIYSGFIFSSVISIAGAAHNQLSFAKEVPILGIIQVAKLITFIVTSILIISVLIDESPAYILSGFGALAAVLLLVFKDTILGFVASIQIAANRLVKDGDWIQFDQYGADGEIEELGLNTVKVRNWDKTITTVPTYALISQSFKNWRGMQESGGRRIKRAIHLDLNSIRLIDSDFLETLKSNEFITQVLSNEELDNAKAQSNVKLFRAYAEEYLRQHEALNHNLTLMVRELAPSAEGLPVELYCFSADKRWIPYEHLQADIMDHLLASLNMFGLRPYQHVTGQLTG